MKSIVTFTFAIALALGCAADTARADDEPKADENFDESAVLYTLGHVLARNVDAQLKPLKLDDGEMKRVVKGLRDGLDGRKPEVDLAEHEPKIQDLARVRMAATAAAERAPRREESNPFRHPPSAAGGQRPRSWIRECFRC